MLAFIVWTVEAAIRRRGIAHPWIYGWAASCVFLSSSIAFVCLNGGWGLVWSLILAILVGATAYPVFRNLMEVVRITPRRVYVDQAYDDPPLDAPLYQATDFGGASKPIRVEQPQPAEPEPPPRVFRWQEANIPEFRRAAVLTGAGVAVILSGMALIMQPAWRNAEARDVVAVLEEAGYPAARVQPAPNGNNCAAGREEPYRWSAPGAQGGACRSRSGRVTYWVDQAWRRDGAEPPL